MSIIIPENLLYSKEHEWVLIDGDIATVGITHHAQEQLGDIVFAEFPRIGEQLVVGDGFGVVESTKAVSDVFSPVDGQVVEINEGVIEAPELINQEPYEQGWLIKIKIKNKPSNLMDAAAYKTYIEEE